MRRDGSAGPLIGRLLSRARRGTAACLCCAALAWPIAPALADDLASQRAAAHQLVRNQEPGGLLDFDMDFLAGKGTGSGTDAIQKAAFIARQAAAAYGLAKYFEQTRDEQVREPLTRLIQALGEHSLPVGKSTAQRALEWLRVLSVPVARVRIESALQERGLLFTPSGDGALLAYEKGYDSAWGGGTAMALMAELHYFRASGDARFAALRERWRNGLAVLRVPGNGFREFPNRIDEGPYMNAEAWLAFALYRDTFPNGAITDSDIRDVDAYMIATYADRNNGPFFHWGSMAAARRFATTQDPRFIDFAGKLAQPMLATAPPADAPLNSCTIVEGLAATAATFARAGRADTPLYRTMVARIRKEMDKNNALQLPPGLDRLTPGEGVVLISPRLADYAGAYLFGRALPTVRIDMTHHCISAVAEMQQH
jgi:hypothetical protein